MQAASHRPVYRCLKKLGLAISFSGFPALLEAEEVLKEIERIFLCTSPPKYLHSNRRSFVRYILDSKGGTLSY